MVLGLNGELKRKVLVRKIKKITNLTLAGRNPFKNHGIVNPPIYRTSTVLFKNTKELGKAITNRFETYSRDTLPILDFYKEQNLLHQINGNAKIDDIYK